MKVKRFALFHYELPWKYSKGSRAGALLLLENEQGQSIYSEAAPLQGFSKESLNDAISQLTALKDLILQKNWDLQNLRSDLFSLNLYPSVFFCIESALLHLLDPIIPSPLAVNAHLMGNKEDMRQKIEMAKKDGYKTAKIKISKFKPKEAVSFIKEIEGQLVLRLDVNKAWKFQETQEFFSEFSSNAFEYVEEPLENVKDLCNFAHPFALDESLLDCPYDQLLSNPNLKALILKPTFQGEKSVNIIKKAQAHGLKLTMTTALESGVGIFHLCALLKRSNFTKEPMGLETLCYFKEDLLEDPIVFKEGKIFPPEKLILKQSLVKAIDV